MLDSDDSIALSSTSLKYIWNLKDCALHISPKYSLAFADSLIQPIYRKFAHLTIAMTTKRSLIKLPESVLSLNLSGEINGLQISGSNLQSLTMTDAFPRSLACSRLEAVHFSNDKVSSYIDIYLRKTRTLGSSLIYISQQLIRGRSEWITESAQLGRDRCKELRLLSFGEDVVELQFSYLPALIDASKFGHIAYVDLSFTSVTDVSMLGLVEFLILRYCAGITDVSKLGRQTRLDLSFTSVRAVSHLGDVQSLSLSHTNVDDATGLGDIYDLNLNYTNVADVSMLGGVSILHLQGTPIQDVSSLGIVTVLDISETNIIDIEALSRVIAIRTHIDIISPSWWKGEEVDLIFFFPLQHTLYVYTLLLLEVFHDQPLIRQSLLNLLPSLQSLVRFGNNDLPLYRPQVVRPPIDVFVVIQLPFPSLSFFVPSHSFCLPSLTLSATILSLYVVVAGFFLLPFASWPLPVPLP
jgi:hypothetical protein